MASTYSPYSIHRTPSARAAGMTSNLEVSPLRSTSRTAGSSALLGSSHTGGASQPTGGSRRGDKLTMSLDRTPSARTRSKGLYDEEKSSPYLSTSPYNASRRNYFGNNTYSPSSVSGGGGASHRNAPPTPSTPIRAPASMYDTTGSSPTSPSGGLFSVLKKSPSSPSRSGGGSLQENSSQLENSPYLSTAKELFPQKREKSAPLRRHGQGSSRNEDRTLYYFSRPNTAAVGNSNKGSSARSNSRSLLSSLSPSSGSTPRANSAQIRSLEQRIREREAQLRSSTPSSSILGGLRRHSAQNRDTPSPSSSASSSSNPGGSPQGLPPSATRPYARGLQDLVNSTRNMPSINSARDYPTERLEKLSLRENAYTPRSARSEVPSPYSPLSSRKLAEYEEHGEIASLERHICFRPNALPRGTMTITPAGERGEDKWSTLNRVVPEKLVVSMEEKTVQREVEAYFVLKHNHSENVLQTMFENMSRSGTSTKVLCLHLLEGYAMYILPQENYPVEGQSSPKCFLGALVRMKLLLVWDLDNTLVDCLEAPDSKPGSLNSYIKKSKGSDIMTIQVRDEMGHYAYSVLCKIRPGAVDTLVTLSRKYDMIICTMGMRSYAEAVVSAALDPDGRLFSRIVAREDLDPHPSMYGMFVKDLHKLCRLGIDADPRRTVIVDDSPDVWKQEENVLPVMRYLHFSHPDSCANGYTTSLAAARVLLERLEKRFHDSKEPWNTNVATVLSEIRRS